MLFTSQTIEGVRAMGKDPKTVEVAGMKVENLNEPSRELCHLF